MNTDDAITTARYMDGLAERVHTLRRQKGISQKELSALIGCSPTTMSNLEQGKLSGIAFAHLTALADYFGVTIDYLIRRDIDPDYIDGREARKRKKDNGRKATTRS